MKRQSDIRCEPPQPGRVLKGEPVQTGDHVTLRDGCIALVWDGEFEPGGTLVKLKYAPANGGLRKVAHAFTQPLRYQEELHDLGWLRLTRCGLRLPVIAESDASLVFKALRLSAEVGEPPGPLLDILRDGGVDVAAMRVSGSRAIGIQHAHSDWDLVVPVDEHRLPSIRERLASAVEKGTLAVPPWSGTWKLLDRIFPGGGEAALRGRRFADTLLSGGATVALLFVPPQPTGVCVGLGWFESGRVELHGKVLQASRSAYKRAEYELEDAEGSISVTCYHKAANLLRSCDIISACGWLLRRGKERRLIQFFSEPDRILWWEVASGQASEDMA